VTTPKLAMPELSVGQAGKELTHNQALAILDQLAQAVVVDKDLAAPPGSPANGAMYIVAAAATGAWAGQSGNLAFWLTSVGAWTFAVPVNGWSVWVADEAKRYELVGGAWSISAGGGGGGAPLAAVRSISANETLGLPTINTFAVNSTTNGYVSTIPSQSTVAWTADAEMYFLPSSTGAITITAAAGVSLNGVTAGSASITDSHKGVTLKRIGADAWSVFNLADSGGWTAPSLLNGWINYGSPAQITQYRKIGNRVDIRGGIKTGTANLIFSLPAGFRPAYDQFPPCVYDAGSFVGGALWVQASSGDVSRSTSSMGNAQIQFSFSFFID
jgi:hypothetical protein